MRTLALALLALAIPACEGQSPIEAPDACQSDIRVRDDDPIYPYLDCTEWGVSSGHRWCISTCPVACQGPWPCEGRE